MAILDTLDIIKNLEKIYDSDNAFRVLKDFERVIDELGVYVYDNWEDGELVSGPNIERHWVACTFMWDRKNMPDPSGAKRLLDYDCKVRIAKGDVLKARQIKTPNDFRPGTKKGKLDKVPVWIVEIRIPKKLIVDIFGGSQAIEKSEVEDVQMGQQPNEAMPDDAGLGVGDQLGGTV